MIRQSRKRKPTTGEALKQHVDDTVVQTLSSTTTASFASHAAQLSSSSSSSSSSLPTADDDAFSFGRFDEASSDAALIHPAAIRRKIKSESLIAKDESHMELDASLNSRRATEAASSSSPSAALLAIGSSRPQQFLIYSQLYTRLLDAQAIHLMRMHYFAALLRSFRANMWPTLSIHPPRVASRDEMEIFHSRPYIKFIEQICKKYRRNQDSADTRANEYGTIEISEPLTEEEVANMKEFGLSEENTVFPELWDLFRATIGGTLRAAELLMDHHRSNPLSPIVSMNFGGGRHHADCNCARGFCNCNDIVIGILQMQSYFPRILYLDIDLHHGDGVEEAFAASSSVLTCSFHHFAPGFYPTTGPLNSGKKSAVNVPLREGIDDKTYCALFDAVLNLVLPSFQPNVVVVCAGVDGLAHDRMSPLNLTTHAYAHCIQSLKRKLGHFRKQQLNGETAPIDDIVSTIAPSCESGASVAVASTPFDSATSSSGGEAAPIIMSTTSGEAGSSTFNHSISAPEPSTTEPAATEIEIGESRGTPAIPNNTSTTSSSKESEWPPSPVPILLLGGGGYAPLDAARAFLIMTAAACNVQLPSKIPENDSHYLEYINSQFSVHTTAKPASACANANDATYLRTVLAHIKSVCDARKATGKLLSSSNEEADDQFKFNF